MWNALHSHAAWRLVAAQEEERLCCIHGHSSLQGDGWEQSVLPSHAAQRLWVVWEGKRLCSTPCCFFSWEDSWDHSTLPSHPCPLALAPKVSSSTRAHHCTGTHRGCPKERSNGGGHFDSFLPSFPAGKSVEKCRSTPPHGSSLQL